MTTFGSRLHAHANFVRAVQGAQRRSPDAASSAANAVPTVEGGAPVASIPHNTKLLIAVIAILAAIILGIVTWRLWAWRNRRRAQSDSSATVNEKRNTSSGKTSLFDLSDVENYGRPTTLVLEVAPPAQEAIWVPQVKPWNPVTRSDELKQATTITVTSPKASSSSASSIRTPPPVYVPGQTPVVDTHHLAPSDLKSAFDHADTPITPHVRDTLMVTSPTLASPARHASFAYQQQQLPKPGHVRRSSSSSSAGSAKDANRLPRTMVVAQTFAPSMADELTVAVGERIRMMDEYADGWCLVERGAERGVIPRFCLTERERRSTRTGRSPPPAVTPPSSGGI